jgi:putative tricarboxylic transport membrane protein
MLWKDLKWRRPAAVSLLILAYILGLERLGFVLTSLLFLLVIFKWVEKFHWQKTLLVTVLAVGFSYLLFHTFLKASLPRGILGF